MITVLFILCFNCLLQSMISYVFYVYRPMLFCKRHEVALCIMTDMDEESLLSTGHIRHNTKAEGLQNDIGGFICFRLKRRTVSDNIHYSMNYTGQIRNMKFFIK